MLNKAKREHPLHKVTLSRPFFLQSTEVTVDQFRRFIAATGYRTDAENK
ncbi:MAG: SUMF1/EgtB/PvdO family nonheme iron enzyme [Candidatus Latescibacterota bacterium]